MLDAIVFDVGGVLLGWDPRVVYRQLLPSEAEVEAFLGEVCTHGWNAEQDRGRTWAEATALLCAQFPEHTALIKAYRERWEDMITGPIPGSFELLEDLEARGIPLYALTNFSAETWPLVVDKHACFKRFRGIVVSGVERVMKPDPAIYRLLTTRYGLEPTRILFIDDVPANLEGARACGWQTLHFTSAAQVAKDLEGLLG